ncbi:MAG: flagellar motor switch protein FliN [Anaerolineaceae bacterium]|nr:flagellar motor switch protein FliN [Anaerolineaceae bacterium]
MENNMNGAEQNVGAASSAPINTESQTYDMMLEDFDDAPSQPVPNNLGMLMDVGMQLTVELGRAKMSVKQVLELQQGAVLELDRIAGDAVDIYVNDHLIGRGDVVVVDDKFGVRITELIVPKIGD